MLSVANRKTVIGSTVPVLPKVSSTNTNTNSLQLTNGNNNNSSSNNNSNCNTNTSTNGHIRPTSVENKSYSVNSHMNSLNNSFRNETQLQTQTHNKNSNGSQTNLNNNSTNNNNNYSNQITADMTPQNSRKIKNIVFDKNGYTSTNADSIEEFGLSVTKIDNNKQSTNNNTNVVNTNVVQRKKFGPIIDYRAMINEATKLNTEDSNADPSDRLMKPLAGYIGYNSEWRELAQVISRDIYMNNPNVKWDDIIGLDAAKRTIKEAVVYPIKYPQLFTGILSPWKGLLLYGPPGTGKTLLAKAVATECNTTFFNISASTIVSKWRGDSEKLVRVLFEMARFYAPSTIFMDELESIMSIRGSQGGGGEHEGSRRMKTELLVQMDGLAKSDDLVFLLAASNIPWELDHAMLRRLEKRIIVDLPTHEARKKMFLHHLPPVVIEETNGLLLGSELDYDKLAEMTEGYSGSDIQLVCKEAAMRSVRKVFAILENLDDNQQEVGQLKLDKISTEDVKKVLQSTKPSARQFANKYEAWTKEYESV